MVCGFSGLHVPLPMNQRFHDIWKSNEMSCIVMPQKLHPHELGKFYESKDIGPNE